MSGFGSFQHEQVATIAAIIDAIGRPNFYSIVLVELGRYINCERCLAIKYSRFSAPEFIVNTSMDETAVEIYLQALYRIDPLLRLVTENNVPPVVTFSAMQHEDESNAFYDEIFKSGQILDELSIMLPVIGNAYLAFCFDRDNILFNEEDIQLFNSLYPIIVSAHAVHMRTELLQGLGALFGKGTVGVVTLTEDHQVIYQNPAWGELAGDMQEQTLKLILSQPEFLAIQINGLIAHWENVISAGAQSSAYRAVFLERKSEGYLQADIKIFFEDFYNSYNLSPRERQIVEKTMRGYSASAIAEKLSLSLGTIRNYKQRLYVKLDITSEREIFSLFMLHIFGR